MEIIEINIGNLSDLLENIDEKYFLVKKLINIIRLSYEGIK